MKRTLLSLSLALALASPGSAMSLVNGGFESPVVAPWFITPTAGRTTTLTGYLGTTIGPCSGKWFGFADGGAAEGSPASLTQTIGLTKGQTVRGCVGFLAGDYLPYDDKGYFSVFDGNVKTDIFTSSVAAVGYPLNDWSGWQHWSYTASITGAHTFELGMINVGDNILSSWTVLDAKIPEPGTWAMLIAGFGLVGMAARRRRTAIAA